MGKWRKILNERDNTGVDLTELSKEFDRIDHNLLIAELNACGFQKESINFIYSYLAQLKKEQKLTLRSVHGKCYFQVCLKAPF